MAQATRIQQQYDHRLKSLVRSTGCARPAVQLGVPPSTARGWLGSPVGVVVSLPDTETAELQRELVRLQEQIDRRLANLGLLVVLLRVSGYTLKGRRVGDGGRKALILKAIDQSRPVLRLRSCLSVMRLSSTRFHAWQRESRCELDDVTSCPRTNLRQLTRDKVREIKGMVTADEFRHVSTGSLAILAQRLGRVFSSSSTGYRLVRRNGWRRPRRRVQPEKPIVGIRATWPNEIWHVDVTVIKLLDGTRVYLHGIIDNFSRRVLAWKVAIRLEPASTVAVLVEAAQGLEARSERPKLLADGGGENFDGEVDELLADGLLQRLLAMTDVLSSNPMIESWWKTLKNQWLYLNSLDSLAGVEKLVRFYVEEYNGRIPHSAFKGQTPDEMYFGDGDRVPAELEAARVSAREIRLERNRATSCSACA